MANARIIDPLWPLHFFEHISAELRHQIAFHPKSHRRAHHHRVSHHHGTVKHRGNIHHHSHAHQHPETLVHAPSPHNLYKQMALQPDAVAVPIAMSGADVEDASEKVYKSVMKNKDVLNSKDVEDTGHGNYGCAWAVNEVVKQALGHPVGGGKSTYNMYRALKDGAGTLVGPEKISHGMVIISPTIGQNHGHVGLLGDNQLVYSNSSKTGFFTQNYTVEKWRDHYVKKGLKVFFFKLNH